MSTRIVLVDDHLLVREGLRMLLQQTPDFEVVGEAENGRSAISLVQQVTPDVVIMDVSMPDLNGIDTTRAIMREYPLMKIVALSMHFDRRFVGGMLRAGAGGYLRKACASEEVVRAVRTVLRGAYYISDGTTSLIVKHPEEYLASTELPDLSAVTQREREILQMVAEGKLTKQIANELNLSVKTVEAHRQHIMEKLHLKSNAELVKFAIREGLISLEG